MKTITYLSIILIILSCKTDSKSDTNYEHDESEIQKSISFSKAEKLVGDFKFTEGPATDTDGNVYFTDIPENKIYVWGVDEKLDLFRENTGGANGLYFDNEGLLLACEGQKGLISSISLEGDYTVIASQFEEKRFNQPNDIWPNPEGGIYFTDPKYSDDMQLPQGGMHVYYIHEDRTSISRVTDDLVKPNGLIGTPDGKILYITDPGAGKTFKYNISEEGMLTNKTLFVDVSGDGMTIDTDGNVYLTTDGKKAIDIFSSEGELIASVKVPEQPANVCFGGENKNQLFVTARTSLYRIDSSQTGVD